jgi:hypothetical protein
VSREDLAEVADFFLANGDRASRAKALLLKQSLEAETKE